MCASAVALKVGQFMTPDPMVLDATDTVGTAARMFEQHEFSGAPVIGARGEVIGMISKTDLIRHALEACDERAPRFLFEPIDDEFDGVVIPDDVPTVLVEEVMTTEPITGSPAESIVDVARRMVECQVHRIIIVDESNCPVGMVTALDLLRAFAESPRLLHELAAPAPAVSSRQAGREAEPRPNREPERAAPSAGMQPPSDAYAGQRPEA